MSLLATIVAISAVVTGVNTLLLSAVVRMLRANERGRTAPAALPSVGTPVEAFEVSTLDGALVDAATLSEGTSLVVVLSATCAPCARLAPQLGERAAELPARTLALVVDSSGSGEARGFADRLPPGLLVAIVPPDSSAISAVGAGGGTPTLVSVVDGRVAAAGHDLDSVLVAPSVLTGSRR